MLKLLLIKKNSLFNIKANEDNSILCSMERKKWCDVIRKIQEKFNKNVSNKIDIIQERIKEILLKKKKLLFDKLKLSHDKIYYQLLVNNNYIICNQKLNNINNNEYNKNKKPKNNRKKYYIKKKITINNKTFYVENKKLNLQKSKSVLNLKSYQERVMNLFKFPVILKNETKLNLKKFFDSFYAKKDRKKVKLTDMKIDSEPIYINRFRNIFSMTPQKKIEFLHFVKNYLDNNYKKNEYQTPKLRQKKSNIQELFSMYNYYINNSHENTYSTNYSKPNMYGTSIKLNSLYKNDYRRNNLRNNSLIHGIKMNKSYTPKQNSSPIRIKNINFGNLKSNLYGENNKIRMKKIKFNNNNQISNKKLNFGYIFQKNTNYNKNNKNNLDDSIQLNRNKKKLTINSSINNKIFKKEKITTKTIFDALLRNKCETIKSQMLEKIGGEKIKNIGLKVNINNNIDVRNESYIKDLFLRNKFSRSKSLNEFNII